MAKIVIDPGHGGRDPGALGSKSKEKDNVLKVARRVRDILKSSGHSVKLTRTGDTYVSLTDRANIANSWGADIFISLHDNSAVNKSATGFESYIYNGKVDDETIRLQSAVHKAISSVLDIPDRGTKSANFAVVRMTKMPALLIEYAFISNPKDESILINEVELLSSATSKGILNFLGGENKTKTPSSKKPKTKPSSKKPKPSLPISKKGTDTLAREVIKGLHGNGEDRKKSLGSRYSEVQKRVNEISKGGKKAPQKSLKQLVDEVNRGLHGNGAARKRSLGSRYAEVQREINRMYR